MRRVNQHNPAELPPDNTYFSHFTGGSCGSLIDIFIYQRRPVKSARLS